VGDPPPGDVSDVPQAILLMGTHNWNTVADADPIYNGRAHSRLGVPRADASMVRTPRPAPEGTPMNRLISAAAVALAIVAAGSAQAFAAGTPQRPAGQVVPVAPSHNGGDNGWGNCGHNSSGGNPHSDPDGGGNGGYSKDECAAPEPTDPPADV
jgi:hypothetical protein